MRRQAVRTIALMLGVILAAAAPARAGTITFADVVRAIGASGQFRTASEVSLAAQNGRAIARQSDSTQSVAAATTAPSSSQQQPATGSAQQQQPTPNGTTLAPASSDATLSQSGGQIETVDLGDVTGTVCDCGEIPPGPKVKGGFPWWALAAVPLICVSGICTGDETTPPTPPTPPDTPVPEPMSLLLFGSGLAALGASARRRYGRKQLESELTVATTEEV